MAEPTPSLPLRVAEALTQDHAVPVALAESLTDDELAASIRWLVQHERQGIERAVAALMVADEEAFTEWVAGNEADAEALLGRLESAFTPDCDVDGS